MVEKTQTGMDSLLHRALAEPGGLRAGHTEFRSGEHGDGWVEKGALFSDPRRLAPVARLQAERIAGTFPEAEVVVGAAQCGAVLAGLVAQELRLRLALTHKDSGGPGFHRMFIPPPGSRLVLAEDLIFSGRDVRDQARLFSSSGLELLGVSAWMARPGAQSGVEVLTLAPHPFRTFPAADCPLCRAGEPLEWRGVRE